MNERTRERQQAIRNRNKAYIYNYLLEHPCMDCGESDIVVLEFDHRNPEEKHRSLSEMKNYSIKMIQKEIDKCDVVCANCHKRRTAKMQNWDKMN